jgi:hypothetical protein
MSVPLQGLNWTLHRTWERLSLIAKIALLLCIIIGLFYVMVLCPKQTKLNDLNLAPSHQARLQEDPAMAQARALESFTQSFPPASERANTVKMLMDIADVHNLVLDDVSYTTQHRLNDALDHYLVDFSIFTTYEDAHYFINDVLYQMPYVSINKLDMHRENTSDNIVETALQLALHFDNGQLGSNKNKGRQQ